MAVPVLGLIIPCYNEESVLPITAEALIKLVNGYKEQNLISPQSFICFVNDGSKDRTWEIIKEYSSKHDFIKGIKFSTNFGHQNALLAGMFYMKEHADCMITLDADLQDDVNVIREMVLKYTEGYEIVYGVRQSRETDTFFKATTAKLFYKLMQNMKVKTVYNHADYRLLSKRVARELDNFTESNMFLRGIFPTLGFKSINVYYDRKERAAGETKYPLKKMLSFAWNGITSFSTYPLKLIFASGIIIFLITLGLILWALLVTIEKKTVPGWTSTVIPIFLFSGLQMISVGILGEYIGKIYKEVKARPRYIVDEII